MKKNLQIARTILLQFGNPFKAFLLSFFIYFLLSFFKNAPWSVSEFPYFNYTSDAFLHNQFYFRLIPPSTHDLVVLGDKIFSYWMPFPDILFIPFVYLFGINFSDVFFTLFIGSINVYLICLLLLELSKQNIVNMTDMQRAVLVVFFAFGTVNLTLAPLGRIWFTAQLIGVMAVAFVYLAALKYKGFLAFFLCGLGLSAAFATRNQLFFAGLWPAYYLIKNNWRNSKTDLILKVLVGGLPIILTLSFIFIYNYSRFGNIFETGLKYHNMNILFRSDFNQYGLFNLFYVPRNLFYQFVNYPFLAQTSKEFFMGGSLFLLSPIFFLIFIPLVNEKKNIDNLILLLSIILINIPIIFYFNTGFVQFGSRFSLDFIVPLLVLTAKGIKNISIKIIIVLLLISIFHFFVGFILMAKFG